MGTKFGVCKFCGEQIVWVRTVSGKSMPCDPSLVQYWKDPHGKERIVTPNGEVVACRLDGDPQTSTGIGYVPHWATCRNGRDSKR